MELEVFTNKEENKFRIGWKNEEDFDMCSDENLKSGLITPNEKEEDITELQQSFGATTEYYDFITEKICTKEQYQAHFLNYNSDKIHIVPITTFTSREQAEKCTSILNQW